MTYNLIDSNKRDSIVSAGVAVRKTGTNSLPFDIEGIENRRIL